MRPPLVLLHGFTQTGASWAGVAARLEPRYRPLAPDLRGHGAAGAVRPIDFASVVEDVLALAPGPFALAGYSMGGRIALHVALAAPARVERLVLVGATPGMADPARRAERRAADLALAAELERSSIEDFARRWAAQPLFAGQPPEVGRAAHRDRLRSEPAGLAAALRGIGTGAMAPLWERLGELRMPVDLVVGERDAKFRAEAETMAPRLARAWVHVVAGAGHAVPLEAPDVLARILLGGPPERQARGGATPSA